MPATVQFFASAEAMEQALLVRGAEMTVPERLRELRRLNGRIFAPQRAALRGRPATVQLFRRLPGESDEDFTRRVAHEKALEKALWTSSTQKAPPC